MRVTSGMQLLQLGRNLQNTFSEMTKLQDQIASGLRLKKPSDGPAAAAQVQRQKRDDLRIDTHLDNIQDTSAILQSSVDALTEARQLLTNVQDLAIQAADGSSDPVANEALAQQLDVALDQLLRLSNRQLPDGRHLFAGTATETVPFVVTARDALGRPTEVRYQGANQASEVLIGEEEVATAIISGKVFLGQGPNGEAVYDPATTDAFQIVMAIRDDVRNTRGLPESERERAVSNHLGDLRRISTNIINTIGSQAVQAEVLAQASERLPSIQLRLKEATDTLESTDIAKAVSELTQNQSKYELALSLASRMNELDLTRFLN